MIKLIDYMENYLFYLDWLIDYLYFITSWVANLGVLLHCVGKQQSYAKKNLDWPFAFSTLLLPTPHHRSVCRVLLHFSSAIDIFALLCCAGGSCSPGVLSLPSSLLLSLPMPLFPLPSAQLLCFFASKNWPKRPLLMTYLATARSPFPIDINCSYRLVPAAL